MCSILAWIILLVTQITKRKHQKMKTLTVLHLASFDPMDCIHGIQFSRNGFKSKYIYTFNPGTFGESKVAISFRTRPPEINDCINPQFKKPPTNIVFTIIVQ